MDIYIRSRGVSQGYHWIKLSETGNLQQEPHIPQEFNEIVDSQSLQISLVFARIKDRLLLYITGIGSEKRKDRQNSVIHNSILCVSQDGNNENEHILKDLLIKALRNELEAIANNFIKSSSDGSFEVDTSNFFKAIAPKNNGKRSPNSIQKIGNLSRKQDLADELEQLKYLPLSNKNNGNAFLIVVTEICEKDELKKLKVWRGLSSKVELENEAWNETKKETMFDRDKFKSTIKQIQSPTSKNKLVLVVLALIVSLVLNIGLVRHSFFSTSFESQYQGLKHENQELTRENQELTRENEQLVEKFNKVKSNLIDLIDEI